MSGPGVGVSHAAPHSLSLGDADGEALSWGP